MSSQPHAVCLLLIGLALSLCADPAVKVDRGPDAGRNYGTESDSGAPLLYPPNYDECLASGRPVITHPDI